MGKKHCMIVGVDIGTRCDHTAICFLDGWTITRVEQWPLGLEYPEIIERLRPIVRNYNNRVFMDASGPGDPVVSTLQAEYTNITGIRITGGATGRQNSNIWTVPRVLLLQAFHRALATKKLKISAPDPGRTLLKNEFNQFIFHKNGRVEAKTGHHDDLVFSCCLAVFGKIA